MNLKFKSFSVIPGFGLTFGFTVFYLGLIVLIPLFMLFVKTAALDWNTIAHTLFAPRTLAALRLSFGASLVSALINAFFGLIVAWVLVRYEFPFKKLVDAFVDLPFALPTAVAGICLTAIYAPTGWLGKWLYRFGIQTAFSPLGITIALVFIGIPFVVRTVQPVLLELDKEIEEASYGLGANGWQTFTKVIFPIIFPALLTGTTMAFARALGEYGSVVFIAGNMPMKTEILPLLIMTKLEQYEYAQATAIASLTLLISFVILLLVNNLNAWSRRHEIL